MRELTLEELELIAGGTRTGDEGEIVVTGDGDSGDSGDWGDWGDWGDTDSGDSGGGDGGGDSGGDADPDAEHEAYFKATVKALIPGNALVKEVVATVITEVRNVLIAATSLETKAAAQEWFDQHAQELANWFFSDYNNNTPPGENNPIDAYREIFGGPEPEYDWETN